MRIPLARVLVFVTALWVALPAAAGAAPVRVDARIDPDRGEVGQSLTYEIEVKGARDVSARPSLPHLPDFTVVEGGEQTRVEVVNFRSSRSVVFTWYLFPKRAGKLAIPSVKVRADGVPMSTPALSVDVEKPKLDGVPEAPIYARAEVAPAEAWVGQPLLYTLEVATSLPSSEPRWSLPDFGGLLQESSIKPEQGRGTQVRGGRTYQVYRARIPLFTLRAGEYTIGEGGAQLDVATSRRGRFSDPFQSDPFFRNIPFGGLGATEPRAVGAPPVKVKVKDLPKEGQPAGFTGLVGRFQVSGTLSHERVALGESATLTVRVEGQGNVAAARVELPRSDAFKVYDDQPTTELRLEGAALTGSTEIRKAIVPAAEGRMEIAAVTVSWFDPDAKAYRTGKAGPFPLEVTPGAPGAGATRHPSLRVDQKRVEVLGDDILPIHTGPEVLADQRIGPRHPVLLAALLLPPAGFFTALAVAAGRRRRGDAGRKRAGAAGRNARTALEACRVAAAEGREDAAWSSLAAALRGFLGDRLGVEGNALTAAEAGAVLRRAGAPAELADELVGLLDRAEAGRYAPGPAGGGAAAWVESASDLVARLERVS